MCGGTREVLTAANMNNGLSPRVRGNRHARQCDGEPVRSIPACAGEPSVFVWWLSVCRVYPRVCGGTHIRFHRQQRRLGLSPRVRGNRLAVLVVVASKGSIPACAGEPMRRGWMGG